MEQEHGKPPHEFKLEIDQKPYDWPEEFITGAQIKHLAGITQPDFGVWRIVPGPGDDEPVGDDQPEKLDADRGHNRFITGPVQTTEG